MKETLRTVGICFGCVAFFEVLKRVLTVTLSHVSAGAQILASDLNGVIDQVNTSAGNITTDESNISTLQGQMTTANNNISTLQGSPTFTGKITAQGIGLIAGSISRIAATGTLSIAAGGTSVSHGLGATPDVVMAILDEGAAGTNVVGVNYGSMGSSNFTAYCSGGGNCRFLSIKF